MVPAGRGGRWPPSSDAGDHLLNRCGHLSHRTGGLADVEGPGPSTAARPRASAARCWQRLSASARSEARQDGRRGFGVRDALGHSSPTSPRSTQPWARTDRAGVSRPQSSPSRRRIARVAARTRTSSGRPPPCQRCASRHRREQYRPQAFAPQNAHTPSGIGSSGAGTGRALTSVLYPLWLAAVAVGADGAIAQSKQPRRCPSRGGPGPAFRARGAVWDGARVKRAGLVLALLLLAGCGGGGGSPSTPPSSSSSPGPGGSY